MVFSRGCKAAVRPRLIPRSRPVTPVAPRQRRSGNVARAVAPRLPPGDPAAPIMPPGDRNSNSATRRIAEVAHRRVRSRQWFYSSVPLAPAGCRPLPAAARPDLPYLRFAPRGHGHPEVAPWALRHLRLAQWARQHLRVALRARQHSRVAPWALPRRPPTRVPPQLRSDRRPDTPERWERSHGHTPGRSSGTCLQFTRILFPSPSVTYPTRDT
jgi:hypothetical protein